MKQILTTISTRMDKESLEYIEKLRKMFNIDRSTAIRNILEKGIEEDKKEKALQLYINGKLSLEGAAKFADIYIGEFLELMAENGIELNSTLEEYREGLKNLKKVWN
ncbi:UPF0175 family protein [Candidatus Woesearchaeota archaeon]|nr:UPF0175 family protein [Candidatus Woesearchaeota archaeon]